MNEHDPEERDPAGALAEGEVLDSRQLARAWTLRGTRFRIAGGGGLESVPLLSICAASRLIRRSGPRATPGEGPTLDRLSLVAQPRLPR